MNRPVRALSTSILALLLALPAAATHFRFGTLTWKARPDVGPTTVEFTLTASFRRSGYAGSAADGRPTVGDVITEFVGFTQLFPGDGTAIGQPLQFEVIAVDPIQDWILARAESAEAGAPNQVVLHSYPSANDGGAPWVASIESCCRISPPTHINNPNGSYRLETLVDLAAANTPPVTASAPIVSCELDALCEFFILGSDADGDPLRRRLATSDEASGGSGFVQPGPPFSANALSIDADTGLVSWDTTDAAISSLGYGLYSAQIVLEDLDAADDAMGKTPLDFFIRVAPVPPKAPEFDSPPTPPSGSTLTVGVGETLGFELQASDTDPGDVITLAHIGLPDGMTCDFGAPDSPVTGSCEWTPDETQLGSHIVVFIATDSFGLGASPLALEIVVAENVCQSVEVPPGVAFGHNWSMAYEISEDDGLVLRNVRLGTRKMAERISVPYFVLDTDRSAAQRFELKTDCADEPGRGRLLSFTRNLNSRRLLFEARYRIDQLPGDPGSSLEITQHYEFRGALADGCEPSSTVPGPRDPRAFPCNPFKLTLDYQFLGANGESVQSLNVPERIHARVDGSLQNAATFFTDHDRVIGAGLYGPIARREDVKRETSFVGVRNGEKGDLDNYHQTSRETVTEPKGGRIIAGLPAAKPGCPECFHTHWRWGAVVSDSEFGGGKPLIPRTDVAFDGLTFDYDSPQDVELAVLRYRASEVDPGEFSDLLDEEFVHKSDQVFWYSPTSTLDRDSFFVHFGFFSASYIDLSIALADEQDPVAAGDNLNYTLTLSNAGPGTATDVVAVLDVFDAFLVADQSDDRCEGLAFQVTCFLPALGANRSIDFDLVLDPQTPGSTFPFSVIVNGEVIGGQVELDESNNSAQETTQVRLPVNLTLEGGVSPSSPRSGQELTYDLFYENLSTAEALDVRLVVEVPSTAPVIDFDSSLGSCTLSEGGVEVVCDLGSLPSFSLGSARVTVRPSRSGSLFTTARIESSTPDYEPESDSVSFRTVVRP